MADTIESYEQRADQAAEEARHATLANVRERALRSEAAWRAMAQRKTSVEEGRRRKIAEAASPLSS